MEGAEESSPGMRSSKRLKMDSRQKSEDKLRGTVRSLLKRKMRVVQKLKKRISKLIIEERFLEQGGDFPNFNRYFQSNKDSESLESILVSKNFAFGTVIGMMEEKLVEGKPPETPAESTTKQPKIEPVEPKPVNPPRLEITTVQMEAIPVPTKPAAASNQQKTPKAPTTPAPSPKTSITPAPLAPSPVGSTEGNIERAARQEAAVLARVAELRRQGLWSASQLPICVEPVRNKTHWDYVLEEMHWMAQDFAQERRYKRAAAKKFAREIAKQWKEKDDAVQKAERDLIKSKKKIASNMAKEIRNFWKNVEKVVDYKHQSVLDVHKKQAMGQHLDFIVGQTEKYSVAVKEGLNRAESVSSTSLDNNEEEFEAEEDEEDDDEETIAKAEEDLKDGEVNREIEALQKESEMDLDAVLDEIPQGYLDYLRNQKPSTSSADSDDNSSENEDEEEGEETGEKEVIESPATTSASSRNSNRPESAEPKEEGDKSEELRQKELTEIAEGAEKFLPKGFTLETTKVVTKVPFLLKHDLREYQHVGLDWLVTLYEQNFNGILADEMGLGKTIQTIALLAHLACEKENWGPHLIVVPTTVILNWEMELKKWCPAFKILSYYGSQKERREKRKGWSKHNAFHVCITSYKLVIQDHRAFRSKRWEYFILDEAQNIKNFKSQRWQLLLNFNASRRLLLTGTPLQNNLMELWSLMHFLMPHVFASHRDFKDWFSNPLTGMIEGSQEYNREIVDRLHKVLRPFILRRMKSEVEKQLPKKYEHVIKCDLSKRQRFLYDDFMSRGTTKKELSSGNLMSVLNILMQLRKCCNHPNLFEPRPVQSPFAFQPLNLRVPALVCDLIGKNQSEKPRIPDIFRMNFHDSATSMHHRRALFRKHGKKMVEEVNEKKPLKTPKSNEDFNYRAFVGKHNKALSERKEVRKPALFMPSNVYRQIDSTRPVMVQFPGSNLSIPLSIPPSSYAQGNERTIRLAPLPQGGALSTAVLPNDSSVAGPSMRIASGNVQPNAVARPPAGTLDNSSGIPTDPVTKPTVFRTPGGMSQVIIHGRIPVSMKQGVGGWHPLPPRPGGPFTNQPIRRFGMDSGGTLRPLITVREMAPKRPQEVIHLDPTGAGRFSTAFPRLPNQGKGPGWYPIERSQIGPTANLARVISAPGNQGQNGNGLAGISATVSHDPPPPPPQLSFPQSVASASPLSMDSGATPSVSPSLPLSSGSPPLKRVKIDPGSNESSRQSLSQSNSSGCLESMDQSSSQNGLPAAAKSQTTPKTDSTLLDKELEDRKKKWRVDCWNMLMDENEIRCPKVSPTFGCDAVRVLESLVGGLALPFDVSEDRISQIVHRFNLYVLNSLCSSISFSPTTSGREPHFDQEESWALSRIESEIREARSSLEEESLISKKLSFPELRLIEYDCGKLHKLAVLLRDLKSDGHRCLIFTQMSKMLDILEAFLCYHGYTYYRLDGSTKIMDRQVMMERFNVDERIFCFILSTRSGGVGVNLTGADTVIFYDSDWNPTMDAQAQDRCHRIGQTRDVHIYRLVSEKTVEENVLRKAQQKRRLGEIAIENASFTVEYFKEGSLRDLFNMEEQEEPEQKKDPEISQQQLEKCMLSLEDTQDAAAAEALREEVVEDEAEFDENGGAWTKVETEMKQLLDQLKPVERYAVRYLEGMYQPELEEEIRLTHEEMEEKKRSWMERNEEVMKAEQDRMEQEEADEFDLTYFAHDSIDQMFTGPDPSEIMPIWLPPTPPPTDDDMDLYVDPVTSFLYSEDYMTETQLPPVYQKPQIRSTVKREREKDTTPKERPERNSVAEAIASVRSSVQKAALREKNASPAADMSTYTPRSLFDGGPSSKFRRDLRRPLTPPLPLLEEEMDEGRDWNIFQDLVLLQAVTQGQQMAYNLLTPNFGHAPNWDFVADRVNALSAHHYFSPRQCSLRYQLVVLPREDGRLVTFDPISKKPRKIPITQQEMANVRKGRLKTGQQFQHDGKHLVAAIMRNRFTALKSSLEKRCPPLKTSAASSYPSGKPNEVHSRALGNLGIKYEGVMNPLEMAEVRDHRAKEKLRQQQLQQQQQQQQLQQQQAAQAAALDHAQLARLTHQTTSVTVTTQSGGASSSNVTTSHNYSQNRPQARIPSDTAQSASSNFPSGSGSRGSPSVTVRSQPNVVSIAGNSQLPPGARIVTNAASIRPQTTSISSGPAVATLYRQSSVSSGLKPRGTPPGTPVRLSTESGLPTAVGILHQPRTVIPVSSIGSASTSQQQVGSGGTQLRFPFSRNPKIQIGHNQQLIGTAGGGTFLVSADSRPVMLQQPSSGRMAVARSNLQNAVRKQIPKAGPPVRTSGGIQLIQYPRIAGGNPVQLIRQGPQRQSSVPVSSQEIVGTIPSINVLMGSRNVTAQSTGPSPRTLAANPSTSQESSDSQSSQTHQTPTTAAN